MNEGKYTKCCGRFGGSLEMGVDEIYDDIDRRLTLLEGKQQEGDTVPVNNGWAQEVTTKSIHGILCNVANRVLAISVAEAELQRRLDDVCACNPREGCGNQGARSFVGGERDLCEDCTWPPAQERIEAEVQRRLDAAKLSSFDEESQVYLIKVEREVDSDGTIYCDAQVYTKDGTKYSTMPSYQTPGEALVSVCKDADIVMPATKPTRRAQVAEAFLKAAEDGGTAWIMFLANEQEGIHYPNYVRLKAMAAVLDEAAKDEVSSLSAFTGTRL